MCEFCPRIFEDEQSCLIHERTHQSHTATSVSGSPVVSCALARVNLDCKQTGVSDTSYNCNSNSRLLHRRQHSHRRVQSGRHLHYRSYGQENSSESKEKPLPKHKKRHFQSSSPQKRHYLELPNSDDDEEETYQVPKATKSRPNASR